MYCYYIQGNWNGQWRPYTIIIEQPTMAQNIGCLTTSCIYANRIATLGSLRHTYSRTKSETIEFNSEIMELSYTLPTALHFLFPKKLMYCQFLDHTHSDMTWQSHTVTSHDKPSHSDITWQSLTQWHYMTVSYSDITWQSLTQWHYMTISHTVTLHDSLTQWHHMTISHTVTWHDNLSHSDITSQSLLPS